MAASPAESAVAAARAALAVLSVNERDELLADLRTSTPTPAVRPSNAASSAAPSGAADIRLTSSTLPDTTPAPVPMDVAVGADQDSPCRRADPLCPPEPPLARPPRQAGRVPPPPPAALPDCASPARAGPAAARPWPFTFPSPPSPPAPLSGLVIVGVYVPL
ncbi:uncharacterized protein [Hetaerina americana]|uniref:uncharacterized protein n=1 Tax=Hetaerina americana TaxID=62018 RepID=UPI003A7F2A17